jgi:antitoxin (DNA-binding transcriptional repressor) of toxin-antitoxin stability system
VQHVDLDEAKSRLPDLITAAINGEDIYIDTDDQRAVQLVPVVQPKRRQFGSAKGLIWMAEDFDAPLEDFKDYM